MSISYSNNYIFNDFCLQKKYLSTVKINFGNKTPLIIWLLSKNVNVRVIHLYVRAKDGGGGGGGGKANACAPY